MKCNVNTRAMPWSERLHSFMYNNNDGNDGQIRKGKRTVSEPKLHDNDLPQ